MEAGQRLEKLKSQRRQYFFPTVKTLYTDPLYVVRAKGSRVWDHEGHEYLDAIGGIVTISVGHNHPRIKAKQLAMLQDDAIQHTTPLYLDGYREQLAEQLVQKAPSALQHCYLTNSGSEANEMAIMTAQVATREQVLIALRHAYHGGTGAALSLCGHASWRFGAAAQTPVRHAAVPDCYRCPFGAQKNSCQLECAQDVQKLIETTTHGKIAGMIVEPIMGVGGVIDPPTEYFREVYRIIKNFGGKFIADEVQSGVGRTGKNFFAIQDSGIDPDMITMAKGLGNGAPIGAVMATLACSEALAGKSHFNTFGGDPYQSMQASLVLTIIEDENLIANAAEVGAYLKQAFVGLQAEFPLIGDVRGRGLMLGLELVKDRQTKEPAPGQVLRLLDRCKDQGLLLAKGGLWGSVIRVAPPLNFSLAEAAELVQKLKAALR